MNKEKNNIPYSERTIETHPEEFEERTDRLLEKMDNLLNALDKENKTNPQDK